jgi:hypothetical protein
MLAKTTLSESWEINMKLFYSTYIKMLDIFIGNDCSWGSYWVWGTYWVNIFNIYDMNTRESVYRKY